MKLSELLAMLIEAKLTMDGKNDYKNVANFAQAKGVRLTNEQVWKLINKMRKEATLKVEDDL